MSSMPPGMILFPSEIAILSYFTQHPSTKNLDVRKSKAVTEKILEVVAKFFANKGIYPEGIEIHLVDLLSPLNKKFLKVPELEMSDVQSKLAHALKDCAIGKKQSENKQRDGS